MPPKPDALKPKVRDSIVVTILGRQWELCWRKRLPSVGRGHVCHGECDAPDTPGKQIRIRDGLSDEEHLDVLIHEMLHAAAWHIREDLVDQFATDVAAVLTRLGWKRGTDGTQGVKRRDSEGC